LKKPFFDGQKNPIAQQKKGGIPYE